MDRYRRTRSKLFSYVPPVISYYRLFPRKTLSVRHKSNKHYKLLKDGASEMKTITRNITHYDYFTGSYFTDPVTEYVLVNNIYQWIAHRLPKRLIYFCYIEFMARVTASPGGEREVVGDINFNKATKIWDTYC